MRGIKLKADCTITNQKVALYDWHFIAFETVPK